MTKIRRDWTNVLFWNLQGMNTSIVDIERLNKKHKINANVFLETMKDRDVKNKFPFEVSQRAYKKIGTKGRPSSGIYFGADMPIYKIVKNKFFGVVKVVNNGIIFVTIYINK